MPNYSTIEEKAAEWNISPRHIQFLCRSGKVNGAVKRSGAWAIPDDTPSPAKNNKLNGANLRFAGTKNKIFCRAIELFVQKGYTNVSFKDIASSVGIRQSTIYSHFRTKHDILDAIYDYYCQYYLKERPRYEDIEPILKSGSLIDIIQCVRYEFNEEYRHRMSDITKIIFQRIGVDERARKIAKTLMVDEGINYVENVFNSAVKNGMAAPLDTHAMAVFINAVRIFILYCWIVEPEAADDPVRRLLKDENTLYEYAAKLIGDKKTNAMEGTACQN